MQEKFNLLNIQKELSYTFKDASLARTAFTHISYASAAQESNQRLVFLGKKLVQFVICDYLYTHSSAGKNQLSIELDAYIERLSPERYIAEHSLTKYMDLAPINEVQRSSKALESELFFAICAAIYRDGGLPALRGFLLPMMRMLDKNEHYAPNLSGKVLSPEEKTEDGDRHIPIARVKAAKNSNVSMGRAQTLNSTEAKPEKLKKEPSLDSLLSKKAKSEPKKEISDFGKSEPESTAPQKKFIRDALAPVRLSDELRNFKPKKARTYPEQTSPAPISEEIPKPIYEEVSDEDKNYKSMLQEFIQRNMRSASVLIKYETVTKRKNEWLSSVILTDKVLAKASAESKKSAEKNAARAAYEIITNKNSDIFKWFASLGNGKEITLGESIDYVSKINQYFQKTERLSSAPIEYKKRKSGQKNLFSFTVIYKGEEIAFGVGSSPKEAKQNAAMEACKTLNIK